jgi:hypothetical protein
MEKPTESPETRWSLLEAAIGCLIGIVPGFLCWYLGWVPGEGRVLFPFLIGVLGAFSAILLTRPDVSGRRVLKWTVLLMVAKAVPGPLRKPFLDEAKRERDALEGASPTGAKDTSVRDLAEDVSDGKRA